MGSCRSNDAPVLSCTVIARCQNCFSRLTTGREITRDDLTTAHEWEVWSGTTHRVPIHCFFFPFSTSSLSSPALHHGKHALRLYAGHWDWVTQADLIQR